MRTLLSLLLSLVISATAQAAPPSEESVNALLLSLRAERSVEASLAEMDETFQLALAMLLGDDKLSARQQRTLDVGRSNFNRLMREEFTWAKLRPIIAQVYSESFTQEEIDGLLVFFKSPAGIAYAEKSPVVAQKATAKVQELMSNAEGRMAAEVKRAIEESRLAK